MWNFYVYKWENAYSQDFKCLKSFNEFLYLFKPRKGGALVHVYVWEHIIGL